MRKLLLLIGAASAAAFSLSSCTDYGAYSYGGSYSSGGSYGYGPGYGYGNPNFSTSLFVSTGNARWGYDPHTYCYYDYHRRCFYDPHLNGYYPIGYRPPVIVGCPHPYGWRPGSGYCRPPHYVNSVTISHYHNRYDNYRNLNTNWSRNISPYREPSRPSYQSPQYRPSYNSPQYRPSYGSDSSQRPTYSPSPSYRPPYSRPSYQQPSQPSPSYTPYQRPSSARPSSPSTNYYQQPVTTNTYPSHHASPSSHQGSYRPSSGYTPPSNPSSPHTSTTSPYHQRSRESQITPSASPSTWRSNQGR